MASSDDLEFSFYTNSFLILDSPETSMESRENPSLLVSEHKHYDLLGFVPVSTATSDIYPSPLIENSKTDPETLTRTSRFDEETAIVTQNQSFHLDDDYSKHFTAAENFQDMLSYKFRNDQRENVYSENCVLTSNIALQSIERSPKRNYQQLVSSQTISDFSEEPYVSTMLRSNIQEMEKSNGPTNLNLTYGLQDHQFHPSLYSTFQEEQYDHNNFLLEQLKRIHEIDMQPPKSSDISIQTSMPMRNQSITHKNMALVTTTQPHLTSSRHYCAQDKGKQHVTAMPSLSSTLYNQYQNSYTNSMTQQSGVLGQRSCYDQFENECSSSKMRRIMFPCQEKSMEDSSIVSFWQDANMRSSEVDHHEERSTKNTIYDPLYAGVGIPIDPHF